MDALVAQHARPAFENEGYSYEDQQELSQTVPPLSLKFALPPLENVSESTTHLYSFLGHPLGAFANVHQPSSFLRAMTDDHANPNCPIKLAHGTTTLAFRFQGGIIVATDSRATAGNWIASQTVKKVIEINNCLLGTMAGGAAVWPFAIGRVCRAITDAYRTANTGLLISGCNAVSTNFDTSAEFPLLLPRKFYRISSTHIRVWG